MSLPSTLSPTLNCQGPAATHHAHAHGRAHACKTSNTLRAQQPKIESTAPPETRTGIGKRAYEHSHACTFYENLQHLRCHAQSRTPQKLALPSLFSPARHGAISILLVPCSLVSGPAQSTHAKRERNQHARHQAADTRLRATDLDTVGSRLVFWLSVHDAGQREGVCAP